MCDDNAHEDKQHDDDNDKGDDHKLVALKPSLGLKPPKICKDGDGCEADKHIVDADIVISQPFFPYYLTKESLSNQTIQMGGCDLKRLKLPSS